MNLKLAMLTILLASNIALADTGVDIVRPEVACIMISDEGMTGLSNNSSLENYHHYKILINKNIVSGLAKSGMTCKVELTKSRGKIIAHVFASIKTIIETPKNEDGVYLAPLEESEKFWKKDVDLTLKKTADFSPIELNKALLVHIFRGSKNEFIEEEKKFHSEKYVLPKNN